MFFPVNITCFQKKKCWNVHRPYTREVLPIPLGIQSKEIIWLARDNDPIGSLNQFQFENVFLPV